MRLCGKGWNNLVYVGSVPALRLRRSAARAVDRPEGGAALGVL